MLQTNKSNESQVQRLLKSLGYSTKEIIGIMANISVETGGTFDYTTQQRGGNEYGVFQFDYLQKYYGNYLKEQKISDSAEAQYNYQYKIYLFMNEKEIQIQQLLKSIGYSTKEIIGIMANISVETGGTFDYTTKQRGGNGYGLFQLDFLRKYYDKYLKEQNIIDSAKAQIKFMDSTIKGSNKDIIGQGNATKINQIFKNGTSEQITKCFCQIWQRPGVPHIQRRLEAAKYYEQKYLQSQMPMNSNTLGSINSGFGLSSDRSNVGYSFDNGTRISGGYSSAPKIQISIPIPCDIM